jgi:hypothetical protein
MIAILNVSGERTEGTGPYYGVVLALHETTQGVRDTAGQYDHHDTHRVEVGRVAAGASVGERVRYTRCSWRDAPEPEHLEACQEHECAEGCPVQAARDREYQAGHEWHG